MTKMEMGGHVARRDDNRWKNGVWEDYPPGDWNILGNWQENAWNWKTTLSTLQTENGISPLFSVSVMKAGNGTVTFHLKPDGFGLPDLNYYALSHDSDEIKAYRRLLTDVVLRMNATPDDANVFALNIIDFEQKLAMMIVDKNEMYTQVWITMKELNPELHDLQNNIWEGNQIHNIFASIFPDIEVRDNMQVLITSPYYIKHVINTASETTLSKLNDYFTWTIIRRFLPLMPKSFLDNVMEFEAHITGKTKEFNRWEFCARFIRNAAPLAAQSYIENSTMTRETRKVHEAALETFNVIKSKAENEISDSENIPSSTKEVILKKLKSLKLQIGLKPAHKTKELLKDFYRNRLVVQNGDFIKSYQYALKNSVKFTTDFRANENFTVLNEISKSLLLTKATYNSHTNTIILPTSLISRPYFSTQYPQSVKYARIGVTMAEAVLDLMLENNTFPTKKYLSCLSSEITEVMPPKDLFERNNLSSFISQSLAAKAYSHMLAVKLALESSRVDPGERNALPVMEEFSGDKLFALTYAQTLCSVSTEHRSELDLIRARINGETMFKVIWPHMTDLQKALQCYKKKAFCFVTF